LVQAGVDVKRVLEILRYSDISVTARIYAHLHPNDLADAVEALDAPGHRHKTSRETFT
jgi:site-specific recombinase XerD